MDPRCTSARPPREEGALFCVPIEPGVEVGVVVADVVESGVQEGRAVAALFPRAVHHPKVGVAQTLHILCRRTLIWGGPVVLHADQDAVFFGDVVAPHTHVYPWQVAQARWLRDGEGVVKAALVELSISIQAEQDEGFFVLKGDLVKLSSDAGVHQRGVPLGVPQRHVQGLVFVEARARAQLLVQVQRRGKATILGPCTHTVNDPSAEPGLQGLCFEEGGQIFPRGLFEEHFEIGHVHVAVKARRNDILARLAKDIVSEVCPEVVHDAGAFVIGVSPVDVFVGHGRKGVESFVLHVAFFQYKLLVVFDQIHKGFVSVFPLHKKVAAVFRGPFFQPHVVVNGWGHQISPPVVPQFVGEQVAVGEVALLHHEAWVGNVGWDFEGAVRGQHIPDALPSVRSPPVFKRINGVAEVRKFVLHGVDVSSLARESNRDGSILPFVHVVMVDIGPYGHGAKVRGDGVVQRPSGPDGVAAQRNLLDEVALVVCPSSPCTGDAVGVGGALHKVVKARVPNLAEVGRDGGQTNAQVVDQVAGVVHASPIGVVVGLSPIPNLQCDGFIWLHGSGGIDVQFGTPLLK